MLVRFRLPSEPITFVNVYALNQSDSLDEKDPFYEELNDICHELSLQKTVLEGDFNSHIDRDAILCNRTIDKFGLDGTNSNGFRIQLKKRK